MSEEFNKIRSYKDYKGWKPQIIKKFSEDLTSSDRLLDCRLEELVEEIEDLKWFANTTELTDELHKTNTHLESIAESLAFIADELQFKRR